MKPPLLHAAPLLLLPLALALTGCFRGSDILTLDDDAVAVHAVLETGADTAVLVITRATDEPDPIAYDGVTGAEVRLIADGDTTFLVETPDFPCVDWYGDTGEDSGPGCYRATLPAPIAVGMVYELDIRLADGTRVVGETRAPPPVTVTTPGPVTYASLHCESDDSCHGNRVRTPPYFVPIAEIPVGWDPLPAVPGATVVLHPVEVYFRDTAYPGNSCTFQQRHGGRIGPPEAALATLEWQAERVHCTQEFPELQPARFDSIRGALSVVGFNEDYVRYIEALNGDGIRQQVASSGLEGAYGLFAAISRSDREVILVRDPPPAR